jgi:hypothetical protein
MESPCYLCIQFLTLKSPELTKLAMNVMLLDVALISYTIS